MALARVSGVSAALVSSLIASAAVAQGPSSADAATTRPGGGSKDLMSAHTSYDPSLLVAMPFSDELNQRLSEKLGRAVTAIYDGSKIHVSWRWLYTDSPSTAFNVYRRTGADQPIKLNSTPIDRTTDFVDTSFSKGESYVYFVRTVVGGVEEPVDSAVGRVDTGQARNFKSIPIPGSDHPGKVGIGDLDGDGQYDFVVRTHKGSIDPYYRHHHSGGWGTSRYASYKLRAIKSDGTPMWIYDLGPNIEGGIWYSPFIVYDLDGDGKSEVVAKTSNTSTVYRNPDGPDKGKVTSGPEHLTVFQGDSDGEHPTILAATDWPDRSDFESYNHYSRNLLGVAHLDGDQTPSIIVVRGTYGVTNVRAYDYADGSLSLRWGWNSSEETKPGNWNGQGGHSLHSVDVDGDGRDEIVIGSAVLKEVDGKGVGLWTTGHRDIDHTYVGDLDPNHPGLEIYSGLEKGKNRPGELVGISMRDARTGALLWAVDEPTRHIHDEGMVADIDPRFPGAEGWSGEADRSKFWLHTPDGKEMDTSTFHDAKLQYGAVYWDADPQREVIVDGQVIDYGFPGAHASAMGSIDGAEQIGWADIYGDWREEVIVTVPAEVRINADDDGNKEVVVTRPPELRIYSTSIPAATRHVTLMQDPLYRTDVAHQSIGYHQIPTTSYWLAGHMDLRNSARPDSAK